ncbi:MAG: carboxypeptidase regulatory-like domain-containing protein [Bryobacterales bacterium]|nr:carboxypeptidase regulatory-like domain-containing protein [Bryobacterales bacterium]
MKTTKRSTTVVAYLLAMAPAVFAQSAGTGALAGTVTDPTGAVISGATITLTNKGTNQARTTTTGTDGSYRFSLLPPGQYSVRFTATGFKISEVPNVQVDVTETPVVDRRLEVGAQSEEVTVEAGAEILQTASSTLGTTVGSREVTALPLSNRNYTQIIGLSAGVNAGVSNATAFGKATQDFSVNGGDPGQNNYQMDGVAINNSANSGSSNDSGIYAGIGIPNPDAIQEFKIQTSTYDASYGRNPGANVNVVTKSGTNQLHGSLFEFFRNEDLNANAFFQNRDGGGKQQILRQNQFGGGIGGPIKKDKIFIFGSYSGTRQLNGVAAQGNSSVLLPPLPAGDRSTSQWRAALGAAMCPQNHPGNSNFQTFLPFLLPSIQVACDGSNINPVSLAMLNLKNADGSYYIPGSGTGDFTRVQYSIPAIYHEDQYLINGDYIINSKNALAMRFFYTHNPQTTAFNNGGIPGTPVHNDYSNMNAVLKLTSQITPTLINEARASGQRNYALGTDSTPGTPQGVGQTPIVPSMTELPVTVIFNGPSLFGTLAPSFSTTNQFQYADQISWSHGRHQIRAGYEMERTQWPIDFAGLERGFLFYGTFADWLIGRAGCAPGDTTCSVANPGNTNGGGGNIFQCLFCVRSGPAPNGIVHYYKNPNQYAFVQDDFKVNQKLTLNLGVRWEYMGMYSDKYGNLTNLWLSQIQSVPVPPTGPTSSGAGLVGYVVPNNYTQFYPAPPAGVLVSNRSLPVRTGPPLSNFAPRIGFAYQVSSKLVLRGGAGLFYDRVAGDRFVHGLEQGYPYAITLDYSGVGSAPFSNQNPYPNTPLGTFASRWANFATGATSNLNTPAITEMLHTPLVRQYNLTVQYEFAPKWVLEVGYVGSSGINLVDTYHTVNTALLASPTTPINGITVNTTTNASLRVPILGYQPAGFQVTSYDGVSNYNSLQVTVRKQFSRGLTMQAAYTWSKDLSTFAGSSSAFGGNSANSNNPNNLAQQYGPVAFSRPQRLIVNYSYDLPTTGRSGALGKVLNGWNVSGVTTVQSGAPMTITDQSTGTVFGLGTFATARAQMCPGATYGSVATAGGLEGRLGGVSGGPGYLNTSAFCAAPAAPFSAPAFPGGPLPTLFGNSGPGIILGPGQFDWDISAIKNTFITERHLIQLRAEFFNMFNHPQFGNPGTALDTPATFGQITTTIVNPRVLQFALKYQF